jgi:predicted metalloprotease
MDWEKGEESENVEDRRGLSGRKLAIGGGVGVGAILLLIAALLGVDPQKLNQFLGNAPDGDKDGAERQVEERPLTAEEKRSRKFVATILRFTEVVWDEQFSKAGKRYEKPKMVLFSDEVETGGCGTAPSRVGPFYCPADRTVYLDPTFFDELEQKLGGSRAEFSQAYVIAHEVGHHVQNLLGYSRLVEQKRRTLPKEEYNKWSVRLELQADYLAGVWAYHGQKKFNFIEPGDVESAIKSANAIGDDRLQKRARGFTSPEKYTHGKSEQRVKWFKLGLETGDMRNLKKIFEVPYDEL